jgi:hypothetical protein
MTTVFRCARADSVLRPAESPLLVSQKMDLVLVPRTQGWSGKTGERLASTESEPHSLVPRQERLAPQTYWNDERKANEARG